jgi:hypothetical protein
MKKLIPQLLGFTLPKPTKTVYTVLRQLVQWIPPGMIQRLADEHKLDIRKWSAVSHVVALMYGQLAGCDSLNGIVDAARVHEGEWRNIRGAQPPKRNTFSNANRHRTRPWPSGSTGKSSSIWSPTVRGSGSTTGKRPSWRG